jgi:hypothetical protein
MCGMEKLPIPTTGWLRFKINLIRFLKIVTKFFIAVCDIFSEKFYKRYFRNLLFQVDWYKLLL